MASAITVLITSCKAHYPVAQASGKEDIAYLMFVSAGIPSDTDIEVEVDVTLDNKTNFKAKIVPSEKANRWGTQYSVTPGRHDIVVKKGDKVLYQKSIMTSAQEVKQILLP